MVQLNSFHAVFSYFCISTKIASNYCDSVDQKPLCSSHYQLVFHFVNASKIGSVYCHVYGESILGTTLLLLLLHFELLFYL